MNSSDQGQSPSTSESNPSAAQNTQEIIVDDSVAHAGYANFCKVASTPEELILDLGLNPSPFVAGKTKVSVSQRIIMNHFTAKRLLHALAAALQRHEQTFGVLETDVRKRVCVSRNEGTDD